MNLRIETRTRLIDLAGTMFFSGVFEADIEKQRPLIEARRRIWCRDGPGRTMRFDLYFINKQL